jgi:hypothetical protein
MQLTKLRAAPVLRAEVPPCAPAGQTDGGTASQLIRGVLRTGKRKGRERVIRTMCRVVVTAVAFSVCPPVLEAGPRVLILPLSSEGGAATPSTQEGCTALAAKLTTLEVPATVAPASPAWEELVAQANASGGGLTVGLEIFASGGCPRVLAPRRVAPDNTPAGVALEGRQLQEVVRRTIEAGRTAESNQLAEAIASHGRWCKEPSTHAAAYVLANVRSPVVVVMLPSRMAADLTPVLAATVADAARGKRP